MTPLDTSAQAVERHIRTLDMCAKANRDSGYHATAAEIEVSALLLRALQSQLEAAKFDQEQSRKLTEYVMSAPWFDPVKHAGRQSTDVVVEQMEAAQSALRKYGQHASLCEVVWKGSDCTCGFDAAIAKGGEAL